MIERNFQDGLNFAKELDQKDGLRDFRSRFYTIPGEIYMDGNSLGMCSKDAEEALHRVFNSWKKEGIKIWNIENNKYFQYSKILASKIAPLIKADEDEVAVVGSTTGNVHQCVSTFYKPTKERYKIMVDDLNFPTDRYAVDSIVRLKGYEINDAVKVVRSIDRKTLDEDAIIEAMTPDVALILLSAVLYRSAQLLDMEKITKVAKERGIIIGWDLCHSIGVIPHDFKKIDPDFAIWCNYKYLSAGPGAIAGIYINRRHFGVMPGLAGWFGNKDETQFLLDHSFDPEINARGWQVGSPPLLAMAPLEGVLNIFGEVSIEKIREKSLHITAYLMYLIDKRLVQYGYGIGNPREDHRRGGHVALEHEEAYRVCSVLKEYNVVPDFREPNVIRLAPIALYNTYEEVYKLVTILEDIVKERKYEKFSDVRSLVV